MGLSEKEAVFHLFFRKHPFKGKYTICCGLEPVIEFLNQLKFTNEDIAYLGNLRDNKGNNLFDEGFLNYLQRLEFKCDVAGMPEGTVAFPHEPLLRIKGPLFQVQLIETALLNIMNFSTLIATKASRIVTAAKGDTVLEFGLRRAQGPDGGLSASRAAYIGGCHATSNVLAGRRFGIPVKGTHAHSWVMTFDTEKEAFRQYAEAMPGNAVFLVDTYDTVQGVRNAVEEGKRLRTKGFEMVGIRLDSGDLVDLSIKARKILDEGGFPDASVVASNDLDEYRIEELKSKGAKIDTWGVGTRLATAYDQPALGGVYKLAAIKDESGNWDYRVKLSEQEIKVSNPGVLSVRRLFENGKPVGDVIYNMAEEKSNTYQVFKGKEKSYDFEMGEDLLVQIFEKGKLVYQSPDITSIRENTLRNLELFKDIDNYSYGLDSNLNQLKKDIISKNRKA